MLFLALFLFFIILNGKITLEIALVGVVVCGLSDLLACKVLGWSAEKSRRTLRLLPDILLYLLQLIWEIIKANLAVMKVIVSPKPEIKPIIFTLRSLLKTEAAQTAMANSITITPGTYTVSLDDEVLRVHCLNDSFYLEEMQLVFQKRLVAIEEKERKRAQNG